MKIVMIALVCGAVIFAADVGIGFIHRREVSARIEKLERSLQAIEEGRRSNIADVKRQLHRAAQRLQKKYEQAAQSMDDLVSQYNQETKHLIEEAERRADDGVAVSQEPSEIIEDLRRGVEGEGEIAP